MKYTKNELQADGYALFDAIIQVGKELEKRDTPRSRSLHKMLLSNFNTYDTNQMTKMLNDFQSFLVKSVGEDGKLDVEFVVEHNLTSLKRIIVVES